MKHFQDRDKKATTSEQTDTQLDTIHQNTILYVTLDFVSVYESSVPFH